MVSERCPWCGTDELYCAYHDQEWGVPLHGEQAWFERIVLETMQAGLSWITVLRKREHYRAVCDQFDPQRVAAYDDAYIDQLATDAGVIRNRAKLRARVHNARAFIDLTAKYGSADAFFWRYVDGVPQQSHAQSMRDIPTVTPVSTQMARDLKQHGFVFVGPVMCYALMQATGMVNDHLVSCFRHQELQ